jgi:hypothetical protein
MEHGIISLIEESVAGEVSVKTMLVTFNIDGLVHHEHVPRGQTVNKEFYKTALQHLRDTVHRHRPEKWHSSNWICTMTMPLSTGLSSHEFLAKHNIVTPTTSLLP